MATPSANAAATASELVPMQGLRLLATFDSATFRLIAFLALAPMLLREFGELQYAAVLVALVGLGWLA
jgi:hypothetical protein